MSIFQKIKNSIYNPEYYKEVLAKPASYAVKYFLLFVLFVAAMEAAVFSLQAIPQIAPFVEKIKTAALNFFPNGLEVGIKSGKAFTNAPEPVLLALPQDLKEESKSYDGLKNIVVIDTKTQFSLEKFNEYKTVCWLTQDSLVCQEQNSGVKINPLAGAPDIVFNKNILASNIEKIKPFIKFIYPVIVFGSFAVFYLAYLAYFIYLLPMALLVWLIAKTKGIKLGYKKSYKLGIHLLTLPIIAAFLLNVFYGRVPYAFSLVFILAAVLNIKNNLNENNNSEQGIVVNP